MRYCEICGDRLFPDEVGICDMCDQDNKERISHSHSAEEVDLGATPLEDEDLMQ